MKYFVSVLINIFVFSICNTFAGTYVVTNINDSGPGSLRQAIDEANNNPGPDEIVFKIRISLSGPGQAIIQPLSGLSPISDQVTIDGYSEGTPTTKGEPAHILIVLDGSLIPSSTPDVNALSLQGGSDNSTIRGLQIQGFGSAIAIESNNNTIEGNYILNNRTDGVFITGNTNIVGGVRPQERNVFYDNHVGLAIFPSSSGNKIEGNYFGTNEYGQGDNTDGVDGVVIGGSDNSVLRNVISGYEGQGLLLGRWSENDPPADNNYIQANLIGTDASGTTFIPNGHGVTFNDSHNNTVSNNLIAGNTFHGIHSSTEVATLSSGIGNTFSRNRIYGNGELGIDLGDDFVTPNDPGDTDSGPNNLMNYPKITSATVFLKWLIITGRIDTPNPQTVKIELFGNPVPDPGGDPTEHGEGADYLGVVYPGRFGRFIAVLPRVEPGTLISATATDADGNTSEFAKNNEALLLFHFHNNAATENIAGNDNEFKLVQNYPNPFNPTTVISYVLPVNSEVKVAVYNVAGQKVADLVNEFQPAGVYTVNFDAEHLAGGYYFCRIEAGAFTSVRKMLLLK